MVNSKYLSLPTLAEDHYSRIRYDTLPTGVLVDNFKLLYRINSNLIEIWNLSVEKETLSTVSGCEPSSFDCRLTALTNWAAQASNISLFTGRSLYIAYWPCLTTALTNWATQAYDRQSKDPGSNPGTVEGVSFSKERFWII